MASMPSDPPPAGSGGGSGSVNTSPPPVEPSPPELTVHLQVVSPSVGVNRPLQFANLPASTTVKQLKDKIRQALSFRPADERQRLIHRGHAIVRETDTLLDIFGAEALRVPEKQTIHLVVRDAPDAPSSTASSGASRSQSPAAPRPPPQSGIPPPQHQHQHHHHHHHHQQPHIHAVHNQTFGRRVPFPPASHPPPPQPGPPQANGQVPFAAQTHAHYVATLQQQNQQMAQWLSNVQRDAVTRMLVSQNQRGRAHAGMRGAGDTAVHNGNAPAPPAAAATTSGRASPALGPGSQANSSGLSAPEAQNVLQEADARQAARTMTDAMHRSASSASLHNRFLNQPGVTTSMFPGSASQSGSRRATPEPNTAAGLGASSVPPSATSSTRPGYDVYVLASPEGPRALLFNHGAAETYYTPRRRTPASLPLLRSGMYPVPMVHETHQQDGSGLGQVPHNTQGHGTGYYSYPQMPSGSQTPQAQAHPHQQPPQEQPQGQPQPQQQNGQHQEPAQQNAPAGAAAFGGHPHNPAALPPMLNGLVENLWLVMRLAIFVWLFTTPQMSWSRWLTIVGVAICLFIYGSGLVNGFIGQVRRPMGQQVRNFLPRLQDQQNQPQGQQQEHQQHQQQHQGESGSDQGQQQQQQQDPGAPANRTGRPDPAVLANRLLAERRREGWLVTQYRRLERAGVLFLASIAPGVAETHIAHEEAEAQERLDRQRRAAEERAERAERERKEAEEAEAAEGSGETDLEKSAQEAHQADDVSAGAENDQEKTGVPGQETTDSQRGEQSGPGAEEEKQQPLVDL